MADDIKCSSPSTSKHNESKEQNVYDVENLVGDVFSEAGIKPDSTTKDRLAF